jgi:hypothetical protein
VKAIKFWWLCFLLAMGIQPAISQITTGYFKLIKISWQADKRLIIDEMMQFNEKEADAFWPLYDRHMQKWGRLMEYRISISQQYCNEYAYMKGAQMSKYIDKLVENDVELTKLQKKFFNKIRHILPSARANQFMQIEYEFQLVLLTAIQQRTPFVGDNLKKL